MNKPVAELLANLLDRVENLEAEIVNIKSIVKHLDRRLESLERSGPTERERGELGEMPRVSR